MISGSSRVLYYVAVVAHPLGLALPLPVAEMITNEHSADSIPRLFQELKMKERVIYPSTKHIMPLNAMVDFSLAIINAVLFEYTNEMHHSYLE